MSSHTSLLGLYEPGAGWLFRLPVGWKYLLLLTLAVPPLFLWAWWATLAGLMIAVACLLTSGIPLRRIFSIGWYLWLLLGIMAGYQLVSLLPEAAFVSPGNLLLAVLAARLLTLTTPTPDLMDALATGLRPVRWVGLDPAAASLAVALMIRSIPFLAGALSDARDAARARGVDRNPVVLLTPAVLGAVAYAQRTGEALHARGLPGDGAH